ncbi:MAG: ATP-binding cassette domain-containing protein [Desulfovibrio sp.]|nr:ATP-binding cassette domain-containing protein [Desulfovibrio sp.]
MLSLNIRKCLAAGKRVFNLQVELEIRPECRRIVFFGPSGSGKTQTMRAIAGLMRPDSGRIAVAGRILYDSAASIWLKPQKRQIGYVPQDYALFPHLDVLRNVAFARTGWLGWFCSHKTGALKWLERFQIAQLARQHPAQISGGQKQRVALARALNARPSLLLLDEPFAALDPLLRAAMRREVLAILDSLAIPAVIVTHDPDDVAAFAGALALFNNGQARVIENWQEYKTSQPNAGAALRELLLANQARGADSR